MVATTPYNTPPDPLRGPNHLTAVRWVLAGLVALGHIFLLTEAYEPTRIYKWTGGYMAVNGFFVLSGLLIAKSLDLRRNLKLYFASRALRIYPALIILMMVFIFVFAPLFSDSGGIGAIGSGETWLYALRVLTLGDPEGAPGGIFSGNLEQDFNGPLWTIRFEIAAYILAALGFSVGLFKSRALTFITFVIVQSAYLGLPLLIDFTNLPGGLLPLLRLSSAFLMGMCLWQFPIARRPHWILVAGLIGMFLLWGDEFGGELLATLGLTGLILRFGLSKTKFLPLLKLPDYSYGIYIWHYPAMQAVLYFNPDFGPAELAVFSVPLFLALSAASWHLIEKPALRLKRFKRPSLRPSDR